MKLVVNNLFLMKNKHKQTKMSPRCELNNKLHKISLGYNIISHFYDYEITFFFHRKAIYNEKQCTSHNDNRYESILDFFLLIDLENDLYKLA